MKRIIIALLTACLTLPAMAQDGDDYLPHWFAGFNLAGGALNQTLSHINYQSAYPAALNAGISDLKSIGLSAAGGDFELGFFWGKKRHLGLGAGIMYQQTQANIEIEKFHIEYRSIDFNSDTFRQLISAAAPVKEHVVTTTLCIPLLLRYQTTFAARAQFLLDAGILLNANITNSTTADASFNYEAIYKFNTLNEGARAVYDYSPVANSNDWMIIHNQYNAGQLSALRAQGYNVGTGIEPLHKSSTVTYKAGSVGWVLRPSVGFRLSDRLFLLGGVHFMMQNYSQNAAADYKLTDKAGDYSSLLKSVTKSNNLVYGLNIGMRFYFGKGKDSDGDHIPDRKDKCPDAAGILKFKGCPDTDGDGIPDPEDSCRKLAGSELYHGCPDSDGDGIPDNRDACPHVKGIANFRGCPDTDGDGVPDNKDECPDVAGTVAAHGCPDSDNDGVADKNDDCPEIPGSAQNYGCPYDSTAKTQVHGHAVATHTLLKQNMINYRSGKAEIDPSSLQVLDEAIEELNKNPKVIIFISGYTDDIGSETTNIMLSIARAESVNKYFLSKGIPAGRIITSGYGKKSPIVENNSAENRAKNRRIELKLLLPVE